MRYSDFDLDIGPGTDGHYPVALLHSPAGEAREVIALPAAGTELDNHLLQVELAVVRGQIRARRVASPQALALETFGQLLHRALFGGQIGRCLEMSQARLAEGAGLRLKLRIRAPELALVPWELLRDPDRGEFLALSPTTTLVRYQEMVGPVTPLTVRLPLRILGMVVSPEGLDPLDTLQEQERLKRATAQLSTRGLVNLEWVQGQTWTSLQAAIRRGPWHVFHFIGHGDFDDESDEGVVAFADEDGHPRILSAAQLGLLLSRNTGFRLAVLNSCNGARNSRRDLNSSTAVTLVRQGVPAVVGMQYPISDTAAIAFAENLYSAMASGMPVDAAVGEGRIAIKVNDANSAEWVTPVLYMRSPDGVLFDVVDTPTTTEPVEKEVAPPPVRVADPIGWKLLAYAGPCIGWLVAAGLAEALYAWQRVPVGGRAAPVNLDISPAWALAGLVGGVVLAGSIRQTWRTPVTMRVIGLLLLSTVLAAVLESSVYRFRESGGMIGSLPAAVFGGVIACGAAGWLAGVFAPWAGLVTLSRPGWLLVLSAVGGGLGVFIRWTQLWQEQATVLWAVVAIVLGAIALRRAFVFTPRSS